MNIRHVRIYGHGSKTADKFPNNKIRTTKYTKWNFLPFFLFDQFAKPANFYFLLVSSLQQIPKLSPTGRWGTLVPLLLSLIVSAAKEAFEDTVNKQFSNPALPCLTLSPFMFPSCRSAPKMMKPVQNKIFK